VIGREHSGEAPVLRLDLVDDDVDVLLPLAEDP
jgi:hypothetical protein